MQKILLQIDPDPHPSVFDAVVAIDCGVERLLQYSAVDPLDVRELVHGLIFTRGAKQLKNSAIFVGGKDVERGERILAQVRQSFLGPLRVSVLLDANGANTTAAAAVIAAARHVDLTNCKATVLAGTGAVGARVARLLVAQGARVTVGSRTRKRAEAVIGRLKALMPEAQERLLAVETNSADQTSKAIETAALVIAAGAAGVPLLAAHQRSHCPAAVLIDLNAVPPTGIEGVLPTDSATQRDAVTCYGAIGVGELKMSIHRAAIERLFSSNDVVLDLIEIYDLGRDITNRDWV